MRLRLRDPGHLISHLVMPMLLMALFEPLYGAAVPDGGAHAATGMLVVFSVLSLTMVGAAMLDEREWRTWDRLHTLPLSTATILLGKALPVWLLLMAQQVLLLLFGTYVVGMDVAAWHLLMPAVAVWATVLLAIGSLLAVCVRTYGQLSATCDIGALVVGAVGGAFAPVSMLPGWVQAIAPASPGYWAMELFRAAARGDAGAAVGPAALLAGVGVVAGTVAAGRLGRVGAG